MDGIRRRVAALAMALSLVFLIPAAAPAGAAAVPPGGGPGDGPWFTISGYVLGADGGSLAGGYVSVCSVGRGGCVGSSIAANGRFATVVSSRDSYTVAVTPPWGSRYAAGWYADWAMEAFTTKANQASEVMVNGQDRHLVTMRVPRVIVTTTGAITGRVVGTNGAALAGGSVTACGLTSWCRSATVGWDGGYVIGGLTPDQYRVSIQPPPNMPAPSGWYSVWAPGYFTTNAGSATLVWVGSVTVALPTIVVPVPIVAPGSISGSVIGSDGGSLAGATVMTCPSPVGTCTARQVAWDGTYLLPGLAPGSYVVSIAPPPGTPYLSGFYSSFSAGFFNPVLANASLVPVAYANVPLPRIVVPRILTVGGPAAVPATPTGPSVGTTAARPLALTSWIRRAGTTQVRSMVAVTAGTRVELVARTETYYAGRTVEVWCRSGAGAWARIASRTVAGDGSVVYRFAARDDAAYRLRMPATTTAREAVGLVRRVLVR